MTRTRTLIIRLSPEDHHALRQAASDAGLTVSDYVRAACSLPVRRGPVGEYLRGRAPRE